MTGQTLFSMGQFWIVKIEPSSNPILKPISAEVQSTSEINNRPLKSPNISNSEWFRTSTNVVQSKISIILLGEMGLQSLGNIRTRIIQRTNWQRRNKKCTGKISYYPMGRPWSMDPSWTNYILPAICDWTIENWKNWRSKKFEIRNWRESVFRCEFRWWSSLVERKNW